MSLKGISATTLVEVMVMMVILGISIVGIYTMVDRGRELAMLTDTRLSAINIAREGLESVTTLRDTFALKGNQSGQCIEPTTNTNAFFSIDGQILLDIGGDSNCPEMGTTPPNYDNIRYILGDDRTLIGGSEGPPSDYSVCVNQFGWYSQEFSSRGGPTLTTCRGDPNTSGCNKCSTLATLCEANTTQNCKTRFQRQITFRNDASSGCGLINDSGFCVEVISKVWWGETANDFVELSQIVTTLD